MNVLVGSPSPGKPISQLESGLGGHARNVRFAPQAALNRPVCYRLGLDQATDA
jgi:hypothetical protein